MEQGPQLWHQIDQHNPQQAITQLVYKCLGLHHVKEVLHAPAQLLASVNIQWQQENALSHTKSVQMIMTQSYDGHIAGHNQIKIDQDGTKIRLV